MSAEVREILDRISALSEEDRLLLQRHFAESLEAEWQREAAAARRLAKQRGLTHEDIDRAVAKARYGP